MSWIMISISNDFNRMTCLVLVDGGGNVAGIKIGVWTMSYKRTRNLSTLLNISNLTQFNINHVFLKSTSRPRFSSRNVLYVLLPPQ